MKTCPACGAEIRVVSGAGRTRKYRGEFYDIPESFPIRTCVGCGSEWMNLQEIRALGDVLEDARKRRLSPTMDGDDQDR